LEVYDCPKFDEKKLSNSVIRLKIIF